MKKILSVICFLFIFGQESAKADLLLEPYIGYSINQQEQDTALGTQEFTQTGSIMGARVGWQSFGLMLGAEYGYAPTLTSELTLAKLGGAEGTEVEYSGTYMGAFVGYDFPILVRAWATYFFDVTYSPETGSDLTATGTSFGVGFTGLPFVSLNAEYRILSYEDSAYDSTEVFLSASLPLTF
tara:strand:+ start:1454 stop:1999 length:546 start_codon:yes stop_codon:yes gene_type:complete